MSIAIKWAQNPGKICVQHLYQIYIHGCTSIPKLYVAGGAAQTGLHGGNRLASASLLEALVWRAIVLQNMLVEMKAITM